MYHKNRLIKAHEKVGYQKQVRENFYYIIPIVHGIFLDFFVAILCSRRNFTQFVALFCEQITESWKKLLCSFALFVEKDTPFFGLQLFCLYLQPNDLGVGVVGVCEVDFLQPTHDKQNFNQSSEYK